ncbi:MAG: GNAT family N-acetyltransferase [Actinobacteria bacterium]|nr:GNAT family N-acetyltransferase [Actinomycetota bacterium]
MTLSIATAREQPGLAEKASGLAANVWPEYNKHGDVLNEFWARLESEFGDFQFVLYDDEDDSILAQGHSIPLSWDGTPGGLPNGIDGLVRGAFELREAGREPSTLSALAIEILPAHQGKGLSARMIDAMRSIAKANGLSNVIAPVRPSWKERYPLAAIERYARWTRADGLPFDPWIRTHIRLGGEILRPEPESLRITGTVAEWEEWTTMRFPESGTYVFPHGLAPLMIDRESDHGSYWEPNVWMLHPLA